MLISMKSLGARAPKNENSINLEYGNLKNYNTRGAKAPRLTSRGDLEKGMTRKHKSLKHQTLKRRSPKPPTPKHHSPKGSPKGSNNVKIDVKPKEKKEKEEKYNWFSWV